ncbi:hypothetical protein [Marinobacter maritimus]|uniref:hypothetical protein n=1 Tax=Marinobacter maritimus TaxID=277961 RepID=UPI0011A82C04|nr:hypothetical protein [Marinobacter maritimus]
MFERTTVKVLLVIAVAYAGVWLPYVLGQGDLPAWLSSPYAVLGLIQVMPVYMLDGAGVPWLLQNNGHCGWGWCSPTVFGYIVLVIFWVVVAWLLAWFISYLARRSNQFFQSK